VIDYLLDVKRTQKKYTYRVFSYRFTVILINPSIHPPLHAYLISQVARTRVLLSSRLDLLAVGSALEIGFLVSWNFIRILM